MDFWSFILYLKRWMRMVKWDLFDLSEIDSVSDNPHFIDLSLSFSNLSIFLDNLEVKNDSQSNDCF